MTDKTPDADLNPRKQRVAVQRNRGARRILGLFLGALVLTCVLASEFGDWFQQKFLPLVQDKSIRVSEGAITCIKRSPDGKVIVTCGYSVQFWEADSLRLLRELDVDDWVYQAAFSPDGRTLITGGWRKITKIWDVKSGKLVATLNNHEMGIYAVTCSPDGRWFATGSSDGTVVVSDYETRKTHLKFLESERSVGALIFSPDSKYIAFGGYGGMVHLHDSQSGALKAKLRGHRLMVTTIAFSHDGSVLASGSNDSTICLWDVKTGNRLRTIQTGFQVDDLYFSKRSGYLIAAGGNRTVLIPESGKVGIWEVSTGKRFSLRSGHASFIQSLAVSDDESKLFTVSDDGTMLRWLWRHPKK